MIIKFDLCLRQDYESFDMGNKSFDISYMENKSSKQIGNFPAHGFFVCTIDHKPIYCSKM